MTTDDTACDGCDSESCPANRRMEGETDEQFRERQELVRQMRQIKHKVLVLSGKGGVGKSTVAVNLALALAMEGKKVGLLDVDIHGPTVPKLLQIGQAGVVTKGEKLMPVTYEKLKVMSLGFLLRGETDAVIWRGPMKMGVIRQFLKDVECGIL